MQRDLRTGPRRFGACYVCGLKETPGVYKFDEAVRLELSGNRTTSSSRMVKVAVVGASGGIGQPLSLLLKLDPHVSELALYDVRLAQGVAKDLSHISTNSVCKGYEKDQIGEALRGAHVVLIPAGVPRKPGMTRDDLFKINAGIVKGIVTAIGQHCPDARILIISNPVNSTVPIAVETLKQMGKFYPGNVMGVTTLDVVRAETFLADYLIAQKKSLSNQFDKTRMHRDVTVIGGHSGNTIVPILTKKPLISTLSSVYDDFVHRVQFGGDEVVKAKDGAGSATLSMALAGYRFAQQILKSIHRENTPPLATYVYLPGIANGVKAQTKLHSSLEYFSLPANLLDGRVVSVDDAVLDSLAPQEKKLVARAVQELAANIDKGKQFVNGKAKL